MQNDYADLDDVQIFFPQPEAESLSLRAHQSVLPTSYPHGATIFLDVIAKVPEPGVIYTMTIDGVPVKHAVDPTYQPPSYIRGRCWIDALFLQLGAS